MIQSAHLEYRRYRAPREDRSALVEPPFEQIPALAIANRRCRGHYRYDFQGRSLAELARAAREELIAEALCWTSAYRDVPPAPDPAGMIFLAGHQPQLFHPGVWFKNFALGKLAREQNATAINLVVDSDTMKTHTVRVPGGTVSQPHLTMVPLDQPGPVVPFEERPVRDRGTFLRFGRRAAKEIAPLVPDPLVRSFWPMVEGRLGDTDNLGYCLAQARHQLEGRWGTMTLEVPQSRVCQLPAFAWFAAHLLAELPAFLAVYNEAIEDYRRAHHLRGTAHPVPDLAVDGPWREAPFWIWTAEDPRRRRLFVRPARGELLLTDRQGLEIALPWSPESGLDGAAERFLELPARRIKIRSRALITTLWARLVLGDLFFHGIGGAKYDQVTDAIMARFFGIRPPGLVVLSATLQLPVPHERVTAHDAREIDRRLRDLVWHPETAAEADQVPGRAEELEDLLVAKRRWIETPQTPENARMRFLEIRRINEALQPWVARRRAELLQRQAQVESQLRGEAILSSREYAFCLYPEETLREFLLKQLE